MAAVSGTEKASGSEGYGPDAVWTKSAGERLLQSRRPSGPQQKLDR